MEQATKKRYISSHDYFNTIAACDVEKVERILQHGVNVNAKYKYGDRHEYTTALHVAAKNNCIDIVKLLLKRGANVNIVDEYDDTALMSTDNIEVAQVLLDYGADINAIDYRGNTALMINSEDPHDARLSQERRIEMVRFLLDHGAFVNVQNTNGETALMLAAANDERLQITKLLINGGADVNMRNQDGENVFLVASGNGQLETVKLLLEKGTDINFVDYSGNTALMLCADHMYGYSWAYNHAAIIRLLLEYGADPHLVNNQGKNALDVLLKEYQNAIDAAEFIDNPDEDDPWAVGVVEWAQKSINLLITYMTKYLRKHISNESQIAPMDNYFDTMSQGRHTAQELLNQQVANMCNDIRDGVMPPGQLLVLARLLEIPVSFETMSWRDICAAVREALG